jgi:hypothetical protein
LSTLGSCPPRRADSDRIISKSSSLLKELKVKEDYAKWVLKRSAFIE